MKNKKRLRKASKQIGRIGRNWKEEKSQETSYYTYDVERISRRKGDYLQDSFRRQSLIPAFSAVEEELKQLITTDEWHMVGMLIISGAGVLGNLFLAWKLKNLGKKMGRNKEQV